jgi:non-ribosomal peptide synthase protein (TIGR01720 family)
MDHQVKVRGHRIELGEIEAVLSRHDGVRQAVVLAREDAPGEKRLVAYLVAADGAEVSVTELRRYLKEQLPEYLIPAAYVTLTEMPLTANGKVDRRALPAPEQSRPELEHEYVAARTAVEEQLCRIWSEVLRVERVGVHDNFFELGGDSILTIQIISRARHAGLNLSPAELFTHPTIAALSEIVGQTRKLLETGGGEVPLTPIQQWFFDQNLPEQHHFNQAALLEIPAGMDPALTKKAVEELFTRHDALRLRFINNDGRWQQIVSDSSEAPFSMHDLSAVSPVEQPAVIERLAAEIQTSLNVQEGRVARIALMKLSDTSSRLLVVIHHLAVDMTSWRILLEDFQRAYDQLARHAKVELPAPATSFAAWSRALSRFAQSSELEEDADYWRRAVNQTTVPLTLDLDGENTEDSSAFVLTTLSRDETRWLLHEMPKAFRALPSEVLLTALTQAYAEVNDGESLLVEMEGHGRESISESLDLSRTVGWFTSLYPVRLDISDAKDQLAALKLVKEQTRSVPRGGLGFGVLKYLNAESDIAKLLRQAARPEICFNYIGEQTVPAAQANAIGVAAESYGRTNSERGLRPYLLMITAEIRKGQLSVRWGYSRNLHRETTIRHLARSFKKAFKSLIDCCETDDTTLFTPSDFPDANLSQLELDEFISSIGAIG